MYAQGTARPRFALVASAVGVGLMLAATMLLAAGLDGLLAVVPLLALVALLVRGIYPGEEALHALASARRRRRPVAPARIVPAGLREHAQAGYLMLLAGSRALRAPPLA